MFKMTMQCLLCKSSASEMTEIQIIFDVLLKISSLAEKKIMLMIRKIANVSAWLFWFFAV